MSGSCRMERWLKRPRNAANGSRRSIASSTPRSAAMHSAASGSPRTRPRSSPRRSRPCGGDSTGVREAPSSAPGSSASRGASPQTSGGGERRRTALSDRLVASFDRDAFDRLGPVAETSELARAFASLSESDRELLSLVAWEGLTRAELAVALGTSRAVVRLRLHRARKRLSDALPTTQFRLSGGQEHEWT
jgi:predicted DNA-binding protein (UPF0251 family)